MYYASTAGGAAMGLVFRKDAEAKPNKKTSALRKRTQALKVREPVKAQQENRAA